MGAAAVHLLEQLKVEAIGTEHLLMGLLTVNDCASQRLLHGFGITYESVLGAFTHSYKNTKTGKSFKGLDVSRNALEVIMLAKEESVYDGAELVGTEHILLALLLSGSGKGERYLREKGVSFFELGGRVVSTLETGLQE